MEYIMDRAWIEINLDIVRNNYRKILSRANGRTKIMAVLKANAYGLGAIEIGKVLEEEGCEIFSLVLFEEAMELRNNGINVPILLMGSINPLHVETAIENNISVSFIDFEQASTLSQKALSAGKKIKGHIKLDTGLSRLGIVTNNRQDEALDEIQRIIALEGIQVTGIYTHLTDGEMTGGEALDLFELSLFDEIVNKLLNRGIKLETHCLATIPAVKYGMEKYDYIRVGSFITGLNLEKCAVYGIEQSIQIRCTAAQVKILEKGTPVSYGPLFHTLRSTTVAVANIGYADGIRRTIANKAKFLVSGKEAPVIGKTCCDHTMIDVTDIPDVRAGNVITIIGSDGGAFQPLEAFCSIYPASVAEITSEFSTRLPRFYFSGGKIVSCSK